MTGKTMKLTGLITSLCFVALLGFSALASAEEAFNWRKYEGTTIRILAGKNAYTPIGEKWREVFEQKTGIKVQAEYLGSMPLRQKIGVELSAKNTDLDVFAGMMKTNYQWHKAGWLEPLDKYLNDPAMTAPDYDYEKDAFPKVRSVIDGQTIGITTSVNPQVLMYRKDLFEKHNVKVPTNWEELEEAAKKLTLDTDGDGKTDIYGWIARQAEDEVTAPFANFLYANKGQWLDENKKPVFNSPEAVKAMEFYGRLGRLYGPPGGARLGWQTVIGAFAKGKAAMLLEISIFAKLVIEKSPVVKGKVGYIPFPPPKDGNQVMIFPCNTNHVSSFSQKKGAAWYYVQFMTSKEVSLDYQLNGLATARKSSWEDPKFRDTDTLPELTKIQYEGFQNGLIGFEIRLAGFNEVRPILGRVIFTAYEGGDVQAAADKAVKDVEEIMKRTE